MSIEFLKCKKNILKAGSQNEIKSAVMNLDAKWRKDKTIMAEDDWSNLVKIIQHRIEYLNHDNTQEK
jgi:hypothetical protein